jgi:uncharacterized cupin superfamily protein
MEIANVLSVECELGMEHEGFRIRETQIGPQIGSDLIGGSVYEIDPGKKLWPYHLHHANEEWLVVLRGRPMLRTPEIVEYPDSSKFYALTAKGEVILQTRYGEPPEYWDGES